ncbi:MAG: hypothetical protein GXP24_12045, partial [Planctomycetes bacterium]|nr:hypothetical protein [Planctomycetota bacterium]
MLFRFCSAVVLSALLLVPVAAQTIRFDTNVGTIDMILNPTGNANLQGHVDNMIAYVEAGRYDLTVINRAAEDFVMQMGGFQLDTLALTDSQLNSSFNFSNIPAFDPVVVDADSDDEIDFDVSNLSNTRGTVSLALRGDPDTGTSSFFVNIGDNVAGSAFNNLDASNFVPFATVKNMATIDLILGLQQVNLPDPPNQRPGTTDIPGDDIPVLDGNRLVFVERAFILEIPADGGLAPDPEASLQALSVPE